MAILDKLAGIGSAVKGTLDRTFGSGESDAVVDDDDAAADEEVAPVAALDVAGAFAVLGLPPSSTLDDVRAAARSLGQHHHPGAVAKDAASIAALARVAEASVVAEEHLLPLAPTTKNPTPTKNSPPSSSSRPRATARR